MRMPGIDRQTLVGTWVLERWEYVYADGRPSEYPLGEDAVGFLMYTPDGFVSASLARADRPRVAPNDAADKVRAFESYFGYAGRYVVRDDGVVLHRMAIAPNPALAGVESTRHAVLDGDRLTLSGPDFSTTGSASRTQRIVWRRAQPG
jgi:hypothetical protein